VKVRAAFWDSESRRGGPRGQGSLAHMVAFWEDWTVFAFSLFLCVRDSRI
jgi:hypothetical protein